MTLAHFTASDGTRLCYRDGGTGRPVLCLAGLTRSGTDFDFLAEALPGLRLIRPDYRGRGGSQWTGAATYTVPREAQDAVELLDHLDLAAVPVIGTSRGGMIAMLMAATQKARLTGICFNDIGPVIERSGLEAIMHYVGRNPAARTFDELVARMPQTMTGFSNVSEVRWRAFAERLYVETPAGLRIRYDPALRESFLAAFEGPPVDLWPLFEACADLPLALLRGAGSDLLSAATAAEMRRRRPDMIFAEIADRGHVPFLDEPEALNAIRSWLEHSR
ncbi:MAG: alpha/beta hydrolase [Defluviimonas sp.]|uniref:alpha/beta fold hydrolase n=1 Tax=Albidovulum sp. TaxID=1872424 RepID=UPI001D907B55|nr:alpha/beta hydrolase [Paracoccaceae bacterium]MCC0065097.1 alpha/beta hydrolase [Defluviimonas sp.]